METAKDRTDRQLLELLNELRVALPGAQILLAFLLTVPFATRFGQTSRGDRVALFIGLLATVAGTILLLGTSVYHRVRWQHGGKSDVVKVGNVLFLAGTALLGVGILAAVYLVASFLYGLVAGIVAAVVIGTLTVAVWYLLPLWRTHLPEVAHEE